MRSVGSTRVAVEAARQNDPLFGKVGVGGEDMAVANGRTE